MAIATPSKQPISSIKSKLLKPALTSHYICNFTPPEEARGFIGSRVDLDPNKLSDRLMLACSDAALPGSSLATIDINNDYHGVSEKHAYRRLYDDRADFTFYVDSDEYYVIRFFEAWIGYTVDEQYGNQGNVIKEFNYSYRVNYPEKYRANHLSITKFERKIYGPTLRYEFIHAFPISINSMQVSYDSSQLLKCTVSFSYSRYYINSSVTSDPNSKSDPNAPAISELYQKIPAGEISGAAFRNRSNTFANLAGASSVFGAGTTADLSRAFSLNTSTNFNTSLRLR